MPRYPSVGERLRECQARSNLYGITKYRDKVTLIAEVLMEKETITGEEIAYLMEHDHLPSDEVNQDKEEVVEQEIVNQEENQDNN